MMGLSQSEFEVAIRWEVEPQSDLSFEETELVIRKVCLAIAEKEDLGASELSISLVDKEEIQALNRHYRGIDMVTDVLSFSLLEGDEPEVLDEDSPLALGDIVISWPVMVEQASEYGHSQARELAFLTAHGLYHLLGYDHDSKEDELIMNALQEEILTSLGLTR